MFNQLLIGYALTVALVVARISAFVVVSPFPGQGVPKTQRAALVIALTAAALSTAERLAFFGSVNPARCPTCAEVLKRWLETYPRHDGPVLDLFLADAADDAALRGWAEAQGVSPTAMRRGRITLNHARAPLAGLDAGRAVSPRLMQRIAGQWLPVAAAE